MKNHLKHTAATVFTSPKIIFFLLALAIMGPLLLPGRILALDSPLALNWDTTGYFWGTSDGPQSVFAATYNTAPIAFVLKVLSTLLSSEVAEKLWLVLLFWLCGIGAFNLPYLHGKGRYYAGILYTVNPFTYTRFVAGQWGILGSYALIPIAVTSFIHLLEEPKPRHAVKTVFFLTMIAFLQVHGLALALLVLAILYGSHIAVVRTPPKRSAPMILLMLLLFAGINVFWLMRYAIAGGESVRNMPIAELQYFAAFPPLDVVSLRGFWLRAPYIDISSIIPFWWVLFTPIVVLALLGIYKSADSPSVWWLGLAMLILAFLGIFLAAGPAAQITQGIFEALWEHVPAYRSFRDSHKFVALLAVAYTYLGALGLQSLSSPGQERSGRRERVATVISIAALAVPIFYTLPVFGTWGQLQPSHYPADWLQARSILAKDGGDFNILVLPWHRYMDFAWVANTHKRLANLAPGFFSQPTIWGDNIEIPVAPSESSNPVSRYVEWLLPVAKSRGDFGRMIAPLNAKYIVLFKSADYDTYGFLYKQDDLELVLEDKTVALFRNTHPTARAYLVNDVIPIKDKDLEEYLQASEGQNTLEHLYILGSNPGYDSRSFSSGGVPAQLPITERSPVSLSIETPDKGYLVLTLPQHTVRDGWENQGKSPTYNLGMMPAFQVSSGSVTITLSPFYWLYAPLYALAVVSLVLTAFIYWRWR